MKCVRLGLVLVASCVVTACWGDDIKNINQRLGDFNDRLEKIGKDATDVGVISELGWVSKLIRDSAEGTEPEQKKAREAAAKLFGINADEFKTKPLFETVVKFDGFTLASNQKLQAAIKYFDEVSAQQLSTHFTNAPGNALILRDIRDPKEFRRTPEEIKKLVSERVEKLFSQVSCPPPIPPATQTACSFNIPGSNYSVSGKPKTATSFPGPYAVDQADAARKAIVENWKSVILAPTEIIGVPPYGRADGQLPLPWGLSAGEGPLAVVFVPKNQVAQHPNLKLYGWLQVAGHPETILGPGIQQEALDFRERCLSTSKTNPTPPVPSNSSVGDLCWYAFDLFGTQVTAQERAMTKNAARRGGEKK